MISSLLYTGTYAGLVGATAALLKRGATRAPPICFTDSRAA